jgi:dienelactone hydrolase
MINLKDNAAAPPRTTIRIPTASGDQVEAWLYLPEGDGPHLAVVMAHGIGGIKAAQSVSAGLCGSHVTRWS